MSSVSLNRRSFTQTYGRTTAAVVSQLQRGRTTAQIASSLRLSVKTVATYRGNYTRGMYAPFAYSNGGTPQGSCNFHTA